MNTQIEPWSAQALNRVRHELEKEYVRATADTVARAIDLAKTLIRPHEGAPKLLTVARKELGLLLALSTQRSCVMH